LLIKWSRLRRNTEIGYASQPEILERAYNNIKHDLLQAFAYDFDREADEVQIHGWLSVCAHESPPKESVFWMEIQDLLIRLDDMDKLAKDEQGVLI
jgi:hypothetical protein